MECISALKTYLGVRCRKTFPMSSQKEFLTVFVRSVLLQHKVLKLWDIYIYFQDKHAAQHITEVSTVCHRPYCTSDFTSSYKINNRIYGRIKIKDSCSPDIQDFILID